MPGLQEIPYGNFVTLLSPNLHAHMAKISIDPDIRKAQTLPAAFYREKAWFDLTRDKIFRHFWHYAADTTAIGTPQSLYPFTLLPGVLDEPLVLSKDSAGQGYCLSNVCTHRGKILVEAPANRRLISCNYHGRCFNLDGTFKSMPEFAGVENFPSARDHLAQIPMEEWLGMYFVSPNPAQTFGDMMAPIMERVGWMPLHTLRFDPESSRDFLVQSNWALYCDNYLEGFHIPFVHPALNQAIVFDQYEYHLFSHGNLQVGEAKAGEPSFDIPEGYPDFGRNIYAYYFWVFPNLMFNFYPWGLSLNVVEPLNHKQTRVRFRTYVFEGTAFAREKNSIDETELEDEAVVESVQQGIQSDFYDRGRYSPNMEQGVHHFHRLLSEYLS